MNNLVFPECKEIIEEMKLVYSLVGRAVACGGNFLTF